MTLISALNIKPQSTRFFIAKAAWYDPLFRFPATFETPCLNGVYRSAIFCLPLNKYGHSSRFTSSDWRNHLQWHNTVSTVKVVTCEEFEPGKYRLLYEDRRYGRCIANGSCSWPAGGVDGMLWSALLSVNETRRGPAEQLQSVLPPFTADCDLGWPKEIVSLCGKDQRRKRECRNVDKWSLALFQKLI